MINTYDIFDRTNGVLLAADADDECARGYADRYTPEPIIVTHDPSMVEYDAGFDAGVMGKPITDEPTSAWLRGWHMGREQYNSEW